MPKKNYYFDYAATTPIDPRVIKAMFPYFSDKFGNPSSIHSVGTESLVVLKKCRKILAEALGAADENEVIFTSSATESNNLVLKGIALANKKKGNEIIISPIEHACVFKSAEWLEGQGFKIKFAKVDKYGLVDIEDLEQKINSKTILVSIIHANNEIGTIQDLEKIGKLCRKKGVYFHTDAAQSFGKVAIDVNKMKIDLLTVSSHKMYGPKGVACLYIKKGVKIEPILHGGGQEFDLRSSTINVAGIVGFAKAVEICVKEMKKESAKTIKFRNYIINFVKKNIKGAHLNGHPQKRLPNNINFSFEGIEGESLLMELDRRGIAISTSSACSSAKLEPSRILLAIGLDPFLTQSAIRISLGRMTNKKEINYLLKVLPESIRKLRKMSPFFK
ncbi:MAG: cysteine desulfurase family protein [bacterium]|nr:cysteine desulfurase family protein [bacterium]